MIYFPEKPWLPAQKRPSAVIIQALRQRDFLCAKRKGERYDELDESVLRKRYELPYETEKTVFTVEEWDYFKKLNSYTNTRKNANSFALERPTKTIID